MDFFCPNFITFFNFILVLFSILTPCPVLQRNKRHKQLPRVGIMAFKRGWYFPHELLDPKTELKIGQLLAFHLPSAN